MKKKVDERQELELLKIEHVGFWLMFWLLFGSIIVQDLFMEPSKGQTLAETIILLAGAICIVVGCIKKGQWDYHSEPSLKNYFTYSLGFSIPFSIIFGIARYKDIVSQDNKISMLMMTIGIFFISLFILIFVSISILGESIKKRRLKLEHEYNDEDDNL